MDVLIVLQFVAWTIASFGVLLIAGGSMVAFYYMARAYLDRRLDAQHRRLELIRTREKFTSRIIFGLDFLIASDILITVVVPSLEDVARLGGIVVIRTVLTYIISKETEELEKQERREKEHPHGPSCPADEEQL